MTTTTTTLDRSDLVPAKTPLYIGPGVVIQGSIHHDGPTDERAVIAGELKGDVHWNGVVQVTQGGLISADGKISCRELVVAGSVRGDGVTIEAGVLRLEPSANVQVEEAFLPSGGLEQSRGSFFNGRLRMGADHPFASDEMLEAATRPDTPAPKAAPASSLSGLPAAASFTSNFSSPSASEEDESAGEQVQTKSSSSYGYSNA